MPYLMKGGQTIHVTDGVETRYLKEGWKLVDNPYSQKNQVKPDSASLSDQPPTKKPGRPPKHAGD